MRVAEGGAGRGALDGDTTTATTRAVKPGRGFGEMTKCPDGTGRPGRLAERAVPPHRDRENKQRPSFKTSEQRPLLRGQRGGQGEARGAARKRDTKSEPIKWEGNNWSIGHWRLLL